MNLIPLSANYEIDIIWNDPKNAFGKIYFIQSQKPKEFSEIGTVLVYFRAEDPDITPHWFGECYIKTEHFKDTIVDAITTVLLNYTKCKKPFFFQMLKADWGDIKSRKIGEISLIDDDI